MIILKSDNGDFIYFDVVTQYSRSFASQVSSHPVDGSGVVTDHVIKQNPRIQLVGNITGADFNFGKPELTSEDRSFIGINRIVVESDIAQAVSVSYENSPNNLFPDVIGQFFTDSLPEIQNISEGRDALYSESIIFSVLRSFYENKRQLTLYELDQGTIEVDPIENVFITSLNINETASTGDSFAFDITLEKVTFANLLEAEVPEDVQRDFQKKNAEKSEKGGVGGSDVTGTEREADTGSFLLQLDGE